MALIGLGPRGFVRLKTVEPMFLGSRPEVMSGYEQLLDPISCELSDIYAHVPTLYMIAVENRFRTILELGTRTGVSTQALLAAARKREGMSIASMLTLATKRRKKSHSSVWRRIGHSRRPM